MAISKDELFGSPTFSFTKDGGSAKQLFRVAWTSALDLAEEAFGTVFVAGVGVVRNNVAIFGGSEDFDELPWLQLESMDIRPFDMMQSPTKHTFAHVTMNFKTKRWDQAADTADDPEVPEGTYLTHNIDMGAEFLTLPTSGLEWEDSNQAGQKQVAEDVKAGMLIPTEDHSLTWHAVPDPPFDKIRDQIGTVNDAKFLGHDAETVLFMGASSRREIGVDGVRHWTLDYKFNVKSVKFKDDAEVLQKAGWNHFFRPDNESGGGAWQKILIKDTAVPRKTVYTDSKFDDLFAFSATFA